MDVPSGGLFSLLRVVYRWIVDPIKKWLFGSAYEISTLYRCHRDICRFSNSHLVKDIGYRILWKPYYLRKKLATPMIRLATAGDVNYSKIVLTVTAANSKIKYQDNIILYDICEISTQAALPSIPFRKLKIKPGNVYTPYDVIKIKVTELYDAEGVRVALNSSNEKIVCPFDNLPEELGQINGYVEKWGEIYNLEFIEMEFVEERIRLTEGMIGNSELEYFVRRKLFSVNWIVKVVFWAKNIFFAKQLLLEFEKYLEEYEAHRIWEEENKQTEAA